MARNAIMTPRNVYPRNGNVVVFDENEQFALSFTNNSDALAYYKYTFIDCATNETFLDIIYHNYKTVDDKPVLTFQRGDTIRLTMNRTTFGKTFIDGRHYKYNLTLYSCYPDKTGKYLNQPNCCVPYASGKVLTVNTPSSLTIQDNIDKLKAPEYWGNEDLLISCTYMKIKNEERKVLSYDKTTGIVTLENAFSNEVLDNASNLQYYLFCNYISTSGSESEGSYDFYVRNEIQSRTTTLPVSVGLRCKCDYTQPNNVGLENYRFKVYATKGNTYINGTVQETTSDIAELVDNQNIPIEKDITDNVIGKSIIFKSKTDSSTEPIVTSGFSGTIANYNSTTGIVTLENKLSVMPSVGAKYSIDKGTKELLADSDDIYSYHMCYNFPVYVFGKSFEVETILTTYEKQILSNSDRVSFAMPTKACPITSHEVTINESNHTIRLDFPTLAVQAGDKNIGWYNVYRREAGETTWNFIGFMENQKYFIDYLVGNHRTYEYLIAKTIDVSDMVKGIYNPDNNYKPYTIIGVTTNWDGWTISSIRPYTDYERYYNKNDIRTNEVSNRLSLIFAKEPYVVGETWKFISDIDSGDIIHNLGLTVHVGTSTFPTVTRTNNHYQSGSFTADLLSITCPDNTIYDNIEKVDRWIRFINDDCAFILKSAKGDVWIVAISENTSRKYDEGGNPILTNVSYSWVEIDKANNIEIVPYT